jgi:hypothetical protein
MAIVRFFNSLALIGVFVCGDSSQATESVPRGQTNTIEHLQWIDVHVHLVGGRGERVHDYECAVKGSLRKH